MNFILSSKNIIIRDNSIVTLYPSGDKKNISRDMPLIKIKSFYLNSIEAYGVGTIINYNKIKEYYLFSETYNFKFNIKLWTLGYYKIIKSNTRLNFIES